MSVIFGICKPYEALVLRDELHEIASATERYAADGTDLAITGNVGMGYQPYHTHARSLIGEQPAKDISGNILTFDGRLDNWRSLCADLGISYATISDAEIVLAAFSRWGELSFSKLVGDWSLALWVSSDRRMYFARDHAGTRTLYYQMTGTHIRWGTYLESFVAAGRIGDIDEVYAARVLAHQPIRTRTPFQGVWSVPPAHFVTIHGSDIRIEPHWDWSPSEKITYKSDEEYESHFLELFQRAVERRTGLGDPILAELSGGMDSTSIVCMSDRIRRDQGASSSDLLDTISYYDDSEPNWNELPFFTLTEQHRGKIGIHLKTTESYSTFEAPDCSNGIYLFPGPDSSAGKKETRYNDAVGSKYRVILSGHGGDEVTGGNPDSLPELGDYLASGQIRQLLTQTTQWCLVKRTTIYQLLSNTIRSTAKLYHNPALETTKLPNWLAPRAMEMCISHSHEDAPYSRRFGLLPSSIINGDCWWSIMNTHRHITPGLQMRREFRYPYLDRDLVDFMFRMPPGQLVKPGRRRFMMRRALKDIVPQEILERRRKAYISRGPLTTIARSYDTLNQLFSDSLIVSFGLVDRERLLESLRSAATGNVATYSQSLFAAAALELWLRMINSLDRSSQRLGLEVQHATANIL